MYKSVGLIAIAAALAVIVFGLWQYHAAKVRFESRYGIDMDIEEFQLTHEDYLLKSYFLVVVLKIHGDDGPYNRIGIPVFTSDPDDLIVIR